MWCGEECVILFRNKCVTNVSIQYKDSLIKGYIHPNMKIKSLSTRSHGNGKSGDVLYSTKYFWSFIAKTVLLHSPAATEADDDFRFQVSSYKVATNKQVAPYYRSHRQLLLTILSGVATSCCQLVRTVSCAACGPTCWVEVALDCDLG